MDELSLNNILLTPLKRIPTVGGDVLHALKKSDIGYNGFGEVYFSCIDEGAVKAWKCHKKMTMNIIVPVGEARIVFHIEDRGGFFRSEIIGEESYSRIYVPPGIWFGFQGIGKNQSLIMNFSDIVHDPNEVLHKPLNYFNYNWENK